MLADDAFLAAYSFLGAGTVLRQQPGEGELEAMFRAAQLPDEAVAATRAALRGLAAEMNERAAWLLRSWLAARGLQAEG